MLLGYSFVQTCPVLHGDEGIAKGATVCSHCCLVANSAAKTACLAALSHTCVMPCVDAGGCACVRCECVVCMCVRVFVCVCARSLFTSASQ